MKRGDLYLVEHPTKTDPKKQRVLLVVSRQLLIDSNYSTVICAPVYTSYSDVQTQITLGIEDGLKHQSYARCDELISIPKAMLTNYIGSLSKSKLSELKKALRIALAIE